MNFDNCQFHFNISIEPQQLPNFNISNTPVSPTTLPIIQNSSVVEFFQSLMASPINPLVPPTIIIQDHAPKDNPTNQSITQLAAPILVEEFSPMVGELNQSAPQTALKNNESIPNSNLNMEDIFSFQEKTWSPEEESILSRIDHTKGRDYINFQLLEASKTFNRSLIDCQIRNFELLLEEVRETLIKFPNNTELQYIEKTYIEIIDLKKIEREYLHQKEIDKLSLQLSEDLNSNNQFTWDSFEDRIIRSNLFNLTHEFNTNLEKTAKILKRPIIDCQIRYFELLLEKFDSEGYQTKIQLDKYRVCLELLIKSRKLKEIQSNLEDLGL